MNKKLSLFFFAAFNLWIVGASANISGQHNKSDLVAAIFKENDLDTWEPPKELKKAFPYYWSGFDEDCRPIWVGELGKWDLSKYISKGESSLKSMKKVIHQGFYRIFASIKETPPGCEPVNQIVVIYDAEGFNYNQVISPPVISYFLNVIRLYVPLFAIHVETIYFVNTNFMFKGLIEIARPILGSLMERVEVFGPNKSLWLPTLLKKLPRDQLPPNFGGDKDFKPLKSYGV